MSGKGPEMAQRNWVVLSGWREEVRRQERERGLSSEGSGLIFEFVFPTKEQTEAFKAPSFEFTPLGFNLHCNYSKADTEEKNENRSYGRPSG